DYLNYETTRLDDLIAEKERLLSLLAEKRRALITRAVTRGLATRPFLRESGVSWLEEIPVHWETRRLKFLSPEITVGIVVTPAKYYEATGVPCLRSLNVQEHSLSDADLVFISEESNLLHSKSIIRVGDLVAVRSGQPGTTAVVDQRFDGANCIDLILIRKSHFIDSDFLAHFLNSDPAKMQFLSGSGGAIQQHFNIETAAGLVVPLPPLQEQRDIVAAVSKATSKVDALSTATRGTIALLREKRSAVIAGTVTGRVNVGRGP
ncbi:MAG: restriction endonuclease subunit S, partial [Chloroflexota bacterium]|nr:restriction endonuclease subunit S [Chloroflexota bacterium]